MDKAVYIPSIILGTIFASIYCLCCRMQKRRIDAETAGHCFLCGPSIVAGCLLLAGSVYDKLLRLVGANIYIGLAGFLVLLVTCQKLRKYFMDSTAGQMNQVLQQVAAGRDRGGGEAK
ncbi:MAG: hypothetical protein ACM3X6_08290 [Patescibacteria group bacterium]